MFTYLHTYLLTKPPTELWGGVILIFGKYIHEKLRHGTAIQLLFHLGNDHMVDEDR